MRVQKGLGVLILSGIILAAITSVVLIIWFFSANEGSFSDAKKRTEINRIQTAAHVYKGKLDFYSGVCKDVGVQELYKCNDSETAFAIETVLSNGSYYCADRLFVGETSESIGDLTHCVTD